MIFSARSVACSSFTVNCFGVEARPLPPPCSVPHAESATNAARSPPINIGLRGFKRFFRLRMSDLRPSVPATSRQGFCHELSYAFGVSVEEAIGALDDQKASFALGRGIALP